MTSICTPTEINLYIKHKLCSIREELLCGQCQMTNFVQRVKHFITLVRVFSYLRMFNVWPIRNGHSILAVPTSTKLAMVL